ncbi:NeuD/PglB/VioB family sugar acetyltransferase [bacterium SCSIO 12643]|nr:NeuD/PglB/VioB family sugar acetyltransferase [bacterium SCSIO 12643]
MNKEQVILIGAGGHTRSLITIINYDKYDIVGIYDDSFSPNRNEYIGSVPVVGKLDDIPIGNHLIIAAGNLATKKKYTEMFKEHLVDYNFSHSTTIIEQEVSLGTRNQFFAGVIVNAFTKIGNDNIVNSGAIIEHEAKIGNNNHISVGAVLCGRAKIGNNCFIGASAVIIDGIELGDQITIGANSVVINDITEPGTYVGNPAKKIK